MATNNFKSFGIGAGANVTSQTDYEALAALLTGFQSGKASSAQINKALRQSSTMAYVLAQFISDSASVDVLDNGTPATILANLKTAMSILNSGRLLKIQVFNSTGTYTKTPGAKYGLARALAGGGAGGGTKITSSSQVSAGWGGDAGTYGETSLIDLTNVNTVQVTVGAGGTPVSGGNGNSGGDSSFGNYIAVSGGTGGAYGEAGGTQSIGSDNSGGGTASGTALAFFSSGQSGSGPTCVTTSGPGIKSGRGGDSALGGGGGAVNGVTTTARPAAGKGGGGSGAAVGIGSTNTVMGGKGGDGFVIVMEFA